jgi:predicted enzyme related to lactoylglutathione lyase
MTPTTMSHISTAVVYPVLPAESLSRARSFYHDTLGFEVRDMPELHQFVISAGGGTGLVVYERAHTKAEHTVATFLVEDLHSTMEELRSRGVTFEEYDLPGLKTVGGVATVGGEEAAWFTDTEGNIISVAHMN